MSAITTESQQQEIEFFDGKLNIATGILFLTKNQNQNRKMIIQKCHAKHFFAF